jgi:hypothetical protein
MWSGELSMPCLNPSRAIEIVFPLLAGLILIPAAQGQAGDWRAVENLAPGSRISVKIRFHMRCDFRRATEAALFCEPTQRGPFFGPHEIRFDRKHIREVRVEHSDDANTAVGTTVGGAVGAAVGASVGNSSLSSGGGGLLFGGAGAIIGGFAGRDFPILHGKVIYKR